MAIVGEQGEERMRFERPNGGGARSADTANLYVANCGPAVGLSLSEVAAAFGAFGEVVAVHPADGSGARVVVCFVDASSARAAMEAWGGGAPCAALRGRALHISYALPRSPPPPQAGAAEAAPVALEAEELGIPGISLMKDFVTADEEKELLAAVDARPWSRLAKRRVQHYGHAFLYETRNVDPDRSLGELPSFLAPLLSKLSSLAERPVDQVTVSSLARARERTVNPGLTLTSLAPAPAGQRVPSRGGPVASRGHALGLRGAHLQLIAGGLLRHGVEGAPSAASAASAARRRLEEGPLSPPAIAARHVRRRTLRLASLHPPPQGRLRRRRRRPERSAAGLPHLPQVALWTLPLRLPSPVRFSER